MRRASGFVSKEESAKVREAMLARRLPTLIAAFDGAIKYMPMLCDHPDWTDEQCAAFARKWHAVAIERLRKADPAWNDRIPYCRNIPTKTMLAEAKT